MTFPNKKSGFRLEKRNCSKNEKRTESVLAELTFGEKWSLNKQMMPN